MSSIPRTVTFALSLLPAVSAGAQHFQPPVVLTSGGVPIDVEVGHSAPFVADWDGDGKKDLLVGQYGQGRMRIYRNVGSHERPAFDGFTWFSAGGDVARIWTN